MVSLLLLGLTMAPVAADGRELDEKMAGLAGQVRDILARAGQRTVAVSGFVQKPGSAPVLACGPALERMLARHLERCEVRVDAQAAHRLAGEFAFQQSPGGPLWVLAVTARLTVGGREVPLGAQATLSTEDMRELPQLVGATVCLAVASKPAERNAMLAEAVQQPKSFCEGERQTVLRSRTGGKLGMTIEAGPPGAIEGRSVRVAGGVATVEFTPEDRYRLVLINDADHEVFGEPSVDSINVFDFTQDRGPDGGPKYSGFVIPPRSRVTVAGWHRTVAPNPEGQFRAFRVTELGHGAATLRGRPKQAGQVVVRFCRSYREDDPGRPRGHDLETGFGEPLAVAQEPVRRVLDAVSDVISVRYTRPAAGN